MKTKTRVHAGVVLSTGRTNNFNHNQKRLRASRAIVVKTGVRAGNTPRI
jgi:hypothetical protein